MPTPCKLDVLTVDLLKIIPATYNIIISMCRVHEVIFSVDIHNEGFPLCNT